MTRADSGPGIPESKSLKTGIDGACTTRIGVTLWNRIVFVSFYFSHLYEDSPIICKVPCWGIRGIAPWLTGHNSLLYLVVPSPKVNIGPHI